MKKYYVFLFGIIFIFIFTGCSFLSFNSPTIYLWVALRHPVVLLSNLLPKL